MFPQLNKVLSGNYNSLGERIPKVSRSLYFRLMTRRFDNNWGSFYLSEDSIKINVVANTAGFAITYPNNSGLKYNRADTLTVTWEVSNSNTAPINCSLVNVYLSLDNGATFPFTLATSVPNTGSYLVTLPDTATTQARIKIKGDNNIFFDINNSSFQIDKNISTHNISNVSNNISLYPNPFDHIIYIESKQNNNIIVTDILGKMIYKTNMKDGTINTAQWSSGMYFISFWDAGNKHLESIKIVKH